MQHSVWGDDAGFVMVIDREGREQVRGDLFFSSSGLSWTPDGNEVWFAGELTARGRDLMSLDLTGKLRAVLPAPGRLTLHDVSSDRRVLLATEAARREAVVGRLGEPLERNLTWFDWSRLSGISHDGSFIVFEEQASAVQGVNTVFLRYTDGAPAIRMAEGRARGNPISPDGQWIAIVTGAPVQLHLIPVGAGDTRVIACDLAEITALQFYPDGERLLILGSQPDSPKRLFELALNGDGVTRPITSVALGGAFALSHDASTIAASTDQKIMLVATDGGAERPLPGSKAGDCRSNGLTTTPRSLFSSARTTR